MTLNRSSLLPLMPVLFIGHGTPMNALESNVYTDSWQQLNLHTTQPKAILCISAHWETNGVYVTGQKHPATLHDFGGFPSPLFEKNYPCPGSPQMAQQLCQGLNQSQPQIIHQRGLDHGCWTILSHLYPKADIPVLQLSLDTNRNTREHFDLAKQLAFLRKQGVLIIGSGNIVHNIRKWMSNPHGSFLWAKEFNDHIMTAIEHSDHETLINYHQHHYAQDAVPTPEHYLPLIFAMALQQPGEKIEISQFQPDSLENCSMTSLKIG